MIRKVICFAGILSLISFFVAFVYGEEEKEKFPFLGEIVSDDVNVRAGQNINFERLYLLAKGQKVIVVDKSYGWYKIKLPQEAPCYISQKYVRLESPNNGIVTTNRVNIRAAAGERSSVIGQLQEATRVKIKDRLQDWYRIEPIEGIYGWIADKFVVKRSQEVPPPRIVIELPVSIPQKTIPSSQDSAPKNEEPVLFSVIGRIEDLGRVVPAKSIRHKLIVGEKTEYYLEGDQGLLNSVVHYTVKVEGTIKADPQKHYPYPVIIVTKINSLL